MIFSDGRLTNTRCEQIVPTGTGWPLPWTTHPLACRSMPDTDKRKKRRFIWFFLLLPLGGVGYYALHRTGIGHDHAVTTESVAKAPASGAGTTGEGASSADSSASGEGKIADDAGKGSGGDGKVADDAGKGSVGDGKVAGDAGKGSVGDGKVAGDAGKVSGGDGKVAGGSGASDARKSSGVVATESVAKAPAGGAATGTVMQGRLQVMQGRSQVVRGRSQVVQALV